jgi:hypothetical protein
MRVELRWSGPLIAVATMARNATAKTIVTSPLTNTANHIRAPRRGAGRRGPWA